MKERDKEGIWKSVGVSERCLRTIILESGKVKGPEMPVRTVGHLESSVITSNEMITHSIAWMQA